MIESSISEIFQLNVSRNFFFEMHNLIKIWHYAFQFIRCKIVSFCICSWDSSGLISWKFLFTSVYTCDL